MNARSGANRVRICFHFAEQGGLGLSSPLYAVIPGDLRDVNELSNSLMSASSSDTAPLLDPSLPTLLLLECVLVYLAPSKTNDLLSFFSSMFKNGCAVSYDPFGLDDNFGQVMKRNLAVGFSLIFCLFHPASLTLTSSFQMRGLSLPGSGETLTLQSLTQRLRTNGFAGSCDSLSIKQIRESIIPQDELER